MPDYLNAGGNMTPTIRGQEQALIKQTRLLWMALRGQKAEPVVDLVPELVYVSQLWDDTDLDDLYAGLVIDGDYLYTVAAGAFPGIFNVVSIADPTNLVIVGQVTDDFISGSVFGIAKAGNTVVVASDTDGVLVAFDVTNPTAPTMESSFVIPGGPYNIDAAGNYAYIPDRFSDRVDVIDISDPAAMFQASSFDNDTQINFPVDCKYRDGLLYVMAVLGGGTLTILDVSTPTSTPTVVGRVVNAAFDNCDRFDILGNYAYCASLNGSIVVVDIANPSAPAFVAETYSDNGYAIWDIRAVGSWLFVAQEQWVAVWSLTDPSDPQEYAFLTTPGGAQPFNAFHIDTDGEYIYTANDTNDHITVLRLLNG